MKSSSVPPNYEPSDHEPFMNAVMREYFRRRLMGWRDDLLRDSSHTLVSLQSESLHEADVADRASLETDRAVELRTRDRYRKLVAKIDSAIRRIDDGSYGFCEKSGEPIGLHRLLARPVATLTVEAQENHERMEKMRRNL